MLAPGGVAYVSTPNLLTLAPPGAEKSDNPWHVHEYRAEEFRELCEAHFAAGRAARPLPRPQAARPRAGDQARLGPRPQGPAPDQALLRPLHPGDRRLRLQPEAGRPRPRPGLPRRLPCPVRQSAGDLAIVLHCHMPYVEGFGTYPFGEEWLFDAVIRSYLPVLEVAERLTMTVTPVLADQLEDAGVRGAAAAVPGRVADRRRRGRPAARCRPSAGPPARRSWPATGTRWSCSTRPAATRCGPSSAAAAEGRVALAASAATHAVLPLLATRAGPAAAARRRHPLAPAPLRLGRRLLAARVRLRAGPGVAPGGARACAGSASTRAPTSEPLEALAPVATEAGPVALPIDWEAIQLALVARRLPLRSRPRPVRRQIAARGADLEGRRRRLRPGRRRGGGAAPGGRVPRRRRRPPARVRAPRSGRRGLLVFAIDTELLGHWWSEGAIWLREVLAGRRGGGRAPAHRAARRWPSTSRSSARCAASTWGEDKDLRTWDSPAGRRPRLGGAAAGAAPAAGALAAACAATPRCAPRASCSPPRPATGPSSTSAARRATTPSSGPPPTPRRRWRP